MDERYEWLAVEMLYVMFCSTAMLLIATVLLYMDKQYLAVIVFAVFDVVVVLLTMAASHAMRTPQGGAKK